MRRMSPWTLSWSEGGECEDTEAIETNEEVRTLSQLAELLTHCRLGDTVHCVGSLLTMLQVGVCVVYILCIDTNLDRYLLDI